jgi:hypothetical protein
MLATIDDTAMDDMADWLTDDLAASTATWKIAYFHHPLYTSTDRTPSAALRAKIQPILVAGGVDLVLAGHVHNYERTVPLVADTPASGVDAITYIVSGAGGAPLDPTTPGATWAASNGTDYSYLRLTIDGCTATGAAISDEGATIDSFTLDGCE